MEKAYDIKDLGEKLKARGLHVAEEGAKEALEAVSEWVKESAKISKNPFDDVAIVFLDKLKEAAMKEIEKIDGQPSA